MSYYKLISSSLLSACLLFSSSSFAAVVTSIKPLGFISSALTEGVTTTEVLLPDGASPHTYALRPSDIQRLREAELVVWVGKEMETFLDRPLAQIDKKLTLANVAEIHGLLLSVEDDGHNHNHNHSHSHHHHHGTTDMHIWLSPVIAKQIAIAIHQELSNIRPQDKARLDANLQLFIQQLEQAEQNIVKILDPIKGKGYFVFHDAYQYFEHYFGLTQLGHFTINPDVQPGAQRLHQIRTQLVKGKAQCVFAEPQFRPAIINSVTQGLNVRQGILDPLGMNIALGNESYVQFLNELATQFLSCLKDET